MLRPYEILWLLVVPATIFSWYHILRHASKFAVSNKQDTLPAGQHPKLTFMLAARSLTAAIQGPIDSIRNSCNAVGFKNYDIKLVVDKVETTVDGGSVIVVPEDFESKSKYKARALQFASLQLPDSKDVWILHLDEDARVTPQCVSSAIKYIEGGGKPIANGPSVFPYDHNLLTFYAEAQRQWTFYWLMDQEKTGRVHWLNGSNLLVRSDIERKIGWDFVNCFISEDARFGYEASRKLGKEFGWYGGVTIETPPASVKGLMKQRMRWFYGSILNLKYVPKARLPRRLYSIAAWMDGLVLTLFLLVIFLPIYPQPRFSHPFIGYALSFSGLLWLSRYQIGVYQNLKFSHLSKLKKALLHLGIIPLAPVVDLLCNLPVVLALIKRPRAFEITNKRG